MQRWLSLGNLSWLLLYMALVALITWAMFSARSWAMGSLANDSASENWQEFRPDAERISRSGPVLRRVPPSSEPPTLRLLRDHFPASLAAALFFSSAVFFSLMLMVRGAFARRSAAPPQQFADVER